MRDRSKNKQNKIQTPKGTFKRNHRKNKPQKTQTISFFTIATASIILIFIMMSIIHSTNKHNSVNVKRQIISNIRKNKSSDIQQELTTNQNFISIEEYTEDCYFKIQSYFDKFRKLISFLYHMLYKNTSGVFYKDLSVFTSKIHSETLNGVKALYKIIDEIDSYLDPLEEFHIERKAPDSQVFHTVLLLYFKMLKLAYDQFYGNKLQSAIVEEKMNENGIKFIYQEYYLFELLTFISRLIKIFDEVIIEEIHRKYQYEIHVEIIRLLSKATNKLEKKLFIKFDETIDFRNDTTYIKLSFILNKLEYLRRFVILNIYTFYWFVFDINKNREVVNLDMEISVEWDWSHINRDNENQKNRYFMAKCVNVIRNIELLKKGNYQLFYDIFEESNYQCINDISKLFKH